MLTQVSSSATRTNAFLVFLLIAIAFFAGTVILQIFLSRHENRVLGLILPILSFILSFAYPLLTAVPSEGADVGFFFTMLGIWFIANIPTAFLLLIYFACRERFRRHKEINRMSAQDL